MIDATYTASVFSNSIRVVLVGQITFFHSDPYTISVGTCTNCYSNQVGVDDLLNTFNDWRRNKVNTYPYSFADAAHLYSAYPFETPVLGYAGVGAMCNDPFSSGIESLLSSSDFYNSMISAHEIGHNLGSLHDSYSNSCPASGFIMNAIIGSNAPTQFSGCSPFLH